jgi:hypothetical protein
MIEVDGQGMPRVMIARADLTRCHRPGDCPLPNRGYVITTRTPASCARPNLEIWRFYGGAKFASSKYEMRNRMAATGRVHLATPHIRQR